MEGGDEGGEGVGDAEGWGLSGDVWWEGWEVVGAREGFAGGGAERLDCLFVGGEDVGTGAGVGEGEVAAGWRLVGIYVVVAMVTYSSTKYFSSAHTLNSLPRLVSSFLMARSSRFSSTATSSVIHNPITSASPFFSSKPSSTCATTSFKNPTRMTKSLFSVCSSFFTSQTLSARNLARRCPHRQKCPT